MRVEKYEQDRRALLHLFALADDSGAQILSYLALGEVFVIRDEDVILGHLQVVATHDADVFEIKSIAVSEPHRREGIGRGLVAVAAAYARSRGGRRLIVATAAADLRNLRFYQQLCFRMYRVVQNVFVPSAGYPERSRIDGIRLLDQVFLELNLQ